MIAQLKEECGFAGLTAYCDKLGSDKARIIEHEGVCMMSSKAKRKEVMDMAKKVDIANEKKRTPIEVLTVETMKRNDKIDKMAGKMDDLIAAVSALVAEMRKNVTGNSYNGETREETLKRIESLLKEILRGLSNVTEKLSLEFTDVKNRITKHGDNEAERDKCPQNDNCTISVRLSTIDENTRETREMLTEFCREKPTDAETGTDSNPRSEVPEKWHDLPRYFFYSLPKYRLIQFFHDMYFKGFLRICAWCAATVFLVFICLVLHDNAMLSKENEKNELIRSYIRKKSEYFDGFCIFLSMQTQS